MIFLLGCLLLKQETNGLHLRWLVLDQRSKFIYWLNPKKDVLTIDKESTINIEDIQQIVISPDAKVSVPSVSISYKFHLSQLIVGASK